jgi:hypothetical protein
MQHTTKGLSCVHCGNQQNVAVPEALLHLACPQCEALVALGEALGLTFGQALVVTVLLLAIFA